MMFPLRRLLSFLGFGWYIPAPGAIREGDPRAAPETRGNTDFTYAPGPRAPLPPTGPAERVDAQRRFPADGELVWPGKIAAIRFRNEESFSCRYTLSLTDLHPALYHIGTPRGGLAGRGNSVLLRSGEETVYEVGFAASPAHPDFAAPSRSTSETFSLVITRFDPRRADDPGVVFRDLPGRWVRLPDPGDLRLEATPAEILLRPWRRQALVRLALANGSLLPLSLEMQVRRAASAEEMEGKAETVGTLRQGLPARGGGVWHCLLPRWSGPGSGSHRVTAVGTARLGDAQQGCQLPLALERPISVRYVPWGRRGRDWAVLLGALCLAEYALWGIPLVRAPQVYLTLRNLKDPKGLPENGKYRDLQVTLTPLRPDGSAGSPVLGEPVPADPGRWRFQMSGRLQGWRWPWGWNAWSREPMRFQARVAVKENGPDPGAWKSRYLLPDLLLSNAPDSSDGEETFVASGAARPPWEPWQADLRALLRPHPSRRLRLSIALGVAAHLAGIKGQAERVRVQVTRSGDGAVVMSEDILLRLGQKHPIRDVELAGEASEGPLLINATILPYQLRVSPFDIQQIKPGGKPFPVNLEFPSRPPAALFRIHPLGSPYRVEMRSSTAPTVRARSSEGGVLAVPYPIHRENELVRLTIRRVPSGAIAFEGYYELKTDAPEIVDVEVGPSISAKPTGKPSDPVAEAVVPPHPPARGKSTPRIEPPVPSERPEASNMGREDDPLLRQIDPRNGGRMPSDIDTGVAQEEKVGR